MHLTEICDDDLARPIQINVETTQASRAGGGLHIQDEMNQAACAGERPVIDLINDEEHARSLELMAAHSFPRW